MISNTSHANSIKSLQRALIEMKFMPADIKPNWVFWPQTKISVSKMQEELWVTQTGYYDYQTAVAVAKLQKENFDIHPVNYGILWKKTIQLLAV